MKSTLKADWKYYLAALIWVALLLWGILTLAAYASTTGPQSEGQPYWPEQSTLHLDENLISWIQGNEAGHLATPAYGCALKRQKDSL